MAEVENLSHSAICVHDLKEAEDFYCQVLGGRQNTRVNFHTDDALRGRSINSSNTHFFVRVRDAVLGIYLATEHRQEPPEEQLTGTPRIALSTDAAGLQAACERLKARGKPFEGPVSHVSGPIATSLYFKDPGGNFLELSVPR